MNEQDTAAADAILLMEAEQKVKMRILQVVMDALYGYEGKIGSQTYYSALAEVKNNLQYQIKQTIKNQL